MSYSELQEFLEPGETVEAVVFGDWDLGGYEEPDPPPVPRDRRGVVLSLAEAMPMMDGWDFCGGYGTPECYATYIWTNKRVIWVTTYDGSTWLSSAPRHPKAVMPSLHGG